MNSMSGEKLKGIPYTGTLPAVLTGTKAGYLHRYKIYGNTERTGTPTPENPIVPSECGERTKQLFDYENGNYQSGQYKRDNGTVGYYAGAGYYAEYIPVEPNSSYFLSNVIGSEELTLRVYFYDIDKNWISRSSGHLSDFLITTPSNCKYIQLQISESLQESTNYMLNLGSTALPYEPYGYKLPLTSAGQSVDIYLGESQTTRRIKNLVLTGEEGTWRSNPSITYGNAYNNTSIFAGYKTRSGIGYCTHYPLTTTPNAPVGVYFGAVVNMISDFSEGLDTVAKWTTYLQQQYANGTPVTVWYILTEPETGTLNEPLRKIGNYADTIDSTQTSAQIPTTANSTTISWAGEGLAPSQFDSIQEWVDIPTYTYTNGEWVADN